MLDMTTTIAAVSTAPGSAGRAIVRLTGPEAIALADAVFAADGAPLGRRGGFTAANGTVITEELSLPARAYVFVAPYSYTRQPLVELHVPGHPIAAEMVLGGLLGRGAAPAGPGEFTQRAFLSGRIDLSAAEAVADLIAATTDAQLRSARANASGALARLCRQWTEPIATALADVEASIDMAEEQLDLADPGALADDLAVLADGMEIAAAEAARPAAPDQIPTVALAGRPNAGKSSLLNVLTGLDRAIVSATAGTTRDVLTAPMRLGGGECLLMDLAGLVIDPAGVDAEAHAAAVEALATADLVVWVVDITDPKPPAPLPSDRPAGADLLVAAKADLLDAVATERRVRDLAAQTHLEALAVSSIGGQGLDALRERLARRLGHLPPRVRSAYAMHDGQRRAVGEAVAALRRAVVLLRPLTQLSDRAEWLAVELRAALAALGTLTGEAVGEAILTSIFSRFCIGK